MTKTLIATYETVVSARNAHEDLVASGYPSEKVYFEGDAPVVKVLVPAETALEAREILGRHDALEISEHSV